MKKVIGYIRVSTRQQAKKGLSLADQKTHLTRWAAAQSPPVEVVGWEVDRGRSAKPIVRGKRRRLKWREAVDRYRPGLGRALAHLEAGEADGLLVTKLSRLTRSMRDLDELLDRYFTPQSHYGLQLLSMSDNINTETASGRLVLNVLMSVLQWEREITGERTREIIEEKKSRGEFIGGSAPYGYSIKAADDGPAVVIEDPAEQNAIAFARHCRDAGQSLRAIAKALAARGERARNGREFGPEQVRRLVA